MVLVFAFTRVLYGTKGCTLHFGCTSVRFAIWIEDIGTEASSPIYWLVMEMGTASFLHVWS